MCRDILEHMMVESGDVMEYHSVSFFDNFHGYFKHLQRPTGTGRGTANCRGKHDTLYVCMYVCMVRDIYGHAHSGQLQKPANLRE